MKHPHALYSIGLIVIAALRAADKSSSLEWKDLGNGRLQLLDHGKPALVYNYGPQLAEGAPADRRRSSYIYPLWTPGGVSITEDFPKDHYHHRGLFWGWPVVEAAGAKYDLWMLRGGIENRMDRWIEKRVTQDGAILAVENGWYVPNAGKIVKETVRLRISPASNDRRSIELSLELENTTAGPVTIKGIPDAGKSYGGVNVRFAPREQTRITSDTGWIAKDEDLGSHTWAALEAVYPGNRKALLRIDSDAQNPGGAAQQWCLRHYGFLGASYPGQNAVTLQPGRPLVLRYKVTVADVKSN